MHFRIYNSIDKKVIGTASDQAIHAKIDIHVDHPNFFKQHLWKKVENVDHIVCPKPILEKKAKLTDLISYPGLAGTLLISNKFKTILSKSNHTGLQYLPTSVIANNCEVSGYWIVNPFEFDYACIDMLNSKITRKDYETNLSEQIVPDRTELIELCKTLIFPKSISIDPLFLDEDCNKDFIIMQKVYGGIGFYVSEKIKKEIEDAGCTGIVFTKPEEKYP